MQAAVTKWRLVCTAIRLSCSRLILPKQQDPAPTASTSKKKKKKKTVEEGGRRQNAAIFVQANRHPGWRPHANIVNTICSYILGDPAFVFTQHGTVSPIRPAFALPPELPLWEVRHDIPRPGSHTAAILDPKRNTDALPPRQYLTLASTALPLGAMAGAALAAGPSGVVISSAFNSDAIYGISAKKPRTMEGMMTFDRLYYDSWLNDESINTWLNLVQRRSLATAYARDLQPRAYVFVIMISCTKCV